MKGQTALEYLITYGWAILVILVVLAVLWYYGVFNPAKWSGESVSEGSAFKVVDKKLSGTTLTLILGDKTGAQTTLASIAVSGDVSTAAPFAVTQVISAGGQSTEIAVTPVAPPTGTISAGSFYKFTVTTTYQATGGIAGQKDVAQFNIKAV
jgi:hypothetical protein